LSADAIDIAFPIHNQIAYRILECWVRGIGDEVIEHSFFTLPVDFEKCSLVRCATYQSGPK